MPSETTAKGQRLLTDLKRVKGPDNQIQYMISDWIL